MPKRFRTSFGPAIAFCGLTVVAASQPRGQRSYVVDQTRSRVTIEVGKSGAFSFAAGHTHEVIAPRVAGTITLDAQDLSRSSVHMEIDASALKVTGKGDPPGDVPKVQQVMLSDAVLDVRRYPNIVFESTNVSLRSRTGTTLDLTVSGQLTLHNVIRPVTVPVIARTEADTITASGRFPLKQSDYGIKPVSVAGLVSVKDTLEISFTIVGR